MQLAGRVAFGLDGFDDFLVGETWEDDLRGAAWIFLGPVSSAVTAEDAAAAMGGEGRVQAAGSAVAPAGDLDADSAMDMLIGAEYADGPLVDLTGAAYVVTWASLGL